MRLCAVTLMISAVVRQNTYLSLVYSASYAIHGSDISAEDNNMLPTFSIVINHLAMISDIQRRQLALSQSC